MFKICQVEKLQHTEELCFINVTFADDEKLLTPLFRVLQAVVLHKTIIFGVFELKFSIMKNHLAENMEYKAGIIYQVWC